ncbi:PREDICTED: E3 ubiquitin-protein ligase RNF180-like [Nicrophorus vespilloides]|uniref:E3 ubiquitin-protein ligase RNF180-like n=1 Tax=Nicrophorus vespilloides TaxID=110193 RepID=A0ABM1MXB0_NICVS|nr:PREDICTED: E3 ubiquitin-protein ligase RNF180-like [Nicrophorus vespilloides]
MMYQSMKCKKCRTVIFDEEQCKSIFVNSHNGDYEEDISDLDCQVEETLVFLNEDKLPDWIKSEVEAVQWSKGKLNCKSCNNRLGAFDFVSGPKCGCNEFILPSVHMIKSKIDLIKKHLK